MAQIREELILVDNFSGSFSRFISFVERMLGATNGANSAIRRLTRSQDAASAASGNAAAALRSYQSVASSLERRMLNANTAFEAQVARLDEMRYAGDTSSAAYKRLVTQVDQANVKLDILSSQYANVTAQMGPLQRQVSLEEQAARRAASAQERHARSLQSVKNAVGGVSANILGLNRTQEGLGFVLGRIRRIAITLFSVRRILSALRYAAERAPAEIQKSWQNAGTAIKNLFAGGVVAALQGMQPALDRLSEALNSDAGQRLARGLETLARLAGQAIGFLLDKASALTEFLGNNFQSVMTAAAVVAALFAAKMLVSALATIAMNIPMILLIGLVVTLISGLMAAGVTSEQIFRTIGAGAGWLYALLYNVVANIWNVIASFVEFIGNVFDDPLNSIARLFFNLFDSILATVENTAKALDALTGQDWSGKISGFRSQVQSWADSTFGTGKVTVARMDTINFTDTMKNFGDAGASVGNSLSNLSLENALAVPLQDIASDTGSIKNSVSMSQEDLRMIVDAAERQFVANVNLNAPAPQITINGRGGSSRAQDNHMLSELARALDGRSSSGTWGNYSTALH